MAICIHQTVSACPPQGGTLSSDKVITLKTSISEASIRLIQQSADAECNNPMYAVDLHENM